MSRRPLGTAGTTVGAAAAAAVAVALVGSAALGAAAYARTRLMVVVVTGWSMYPGYRDGDRLLVRRVRPGRLRRGAVAVVAGPAFPGAPVAAGAADAAQESGSRGLGNIVKHVVAVPGDPVPESLRTVVGAAEGGVVPPGRVLLLGEQEHSWDSRQHGYFVLDDVLAVVVAVLGRSGTEPPPELRQLTDEAVRLPSRIS